MISSIVGAFSAWEGARSAKASKIPGFIFPSPEYRATDDDVNQQEFTRWLVERLTGELAQQEWHRVFKAAGQELLGQPLNALVSEEEMLALLEAHLDEERLVALVRPAIRFGLHHALKQAQDDDQPLERYLSDAAKDSFMQLATRPGVIQEAWITELFSQDAMEELGADTLYKALKDFSTIIPRLIESMTPSALGKLARLGGRATGGVTTKLLDEVERRLEPEIKKWLERGTRRALDSAASFATEHRDSPAAVEARRSLLRFFWSQSAAFHARSFTPEVVGDLELAVERTARHVGALPETKERFAKVIADTYKSDGNKKLEDWLETMGVDRAPPWEAWSKVAWSVLETAMAGPAIREWHKGIASEIHDRRAGK